MNTTLLRSKYASDSIETMSPGRMIIALYDRFLLDLDRALNAIAAQDPIGVHEALVHAQAIVAQLHDSLDVSQWPAAIGLADIYRFVYGELVTANVEKRAGRIESCRSIVTPLRDAWREAAGIVPSGGVVA